MSDFDYRCTIMTPSARYVEIRVQGRTQIGEDACDAQRARHLYGVVLVATKVISTDETAYTVVTTYKDLLKLSKDAQAYKRDLDHAILKYGQIDGSERAAKLVRTHQKTKDSIFPIGCALRNIVKGFNDFHNKVWIQSSWGPETRVAPQVPRRAAVAFPCVPHRAPVPSAPPLELLYPPPSYAIREAPPSYEEITRRPSTAAQSKLCNIL